MTTFLAYFIMLGPSISCSWNNDSSIFEVFRDELVFKITWPQEIDNLSLEWPTIEKTFFHMTWKLIITKSNFQIFAPTTSTIKLNLKYSFLFKRLHFLLKLQKFKFHILKIATNPRRRNPRWKEYDHFKCYFYWIKVRMTIDGRGWKVESQIGGQMKFCVSTFRKYFLQASSVLP